MNTHKQQGETDGKSEQFIKDLINRKQKYYIQLIDDTAHSHFSNEEYDMFFETIVTRFCDDVRSTISKHIVIAAIESVNT